MYQELAKLAFCEQILREIEGRKAARKYVPPHGLRATVGQFVYFVEAVEPRAASITRAKFYASGVCGAIRGYRVQRANRASKSVALKSV